MKLGSFVATRMPDFFLVFNKMKMKERKIMRLDKYLKVSRLIKRRTIANEACDAGRVLVNDKEAKASTNVKNRRYHNNTVWKQRSEGRSS